MRHAECFVLGLLLFLCGCAKLETGYGDTTLKSINGFYLMHSIFKERFSARYHMFRSNQLDRYNLIVHCSSDLAFNFDDPANSEAKKEKYYHYDDWDDEAGEDIDPRTASRWLKDWLEARAGRQFLLVLRDGNVAPQLCREWADEFRQLAKEANSDSKKENFEEQARLLEQQAEANDFGPMVGPDKINDCHWFSVNGMPSAQTQEVSGIYNGKAPHTLVTTAALQAANAQTLLSADDRPFIISIPVAKSRLLVVGNATAFVDAALVDPEARAIFSALMDEVASWNVDKSVWLRSMTAGSNSPPPAPNILSMLFLQEPFNYVIIHALILLLVYLFYRACWLGRRRSQRLAVEEQFNRHIDALAYHLHNDQMHTRHCRAIARALGRDGNDIYAVSDEEAIQELKTVFSREHTHRYTRKPQQSNSQSADSNEHP